MIYPPALRRGDRVAVVASSSPFPKNLVLRGMGVLGERYRVTFDRSLLDRHKGYLAGSDERRARELVAALNDPDVRAIFTARGGYGASRIVHDIDWSVCQKHPKWIVGFSDVTAHHLELAAVGVASIHASGVAGLGRADARLRDDLFSTLEAPERPKRFDGLTTIAPGRAAGRFVGGNLALVHAAAAAGRLELPEGCVLFLEDVTERPYRVDRTLTGLRVGGHLARAKAIVFGDFTQCDPGPDGVTIETVLRERTSDLGVPVVRGLPCGHGDVNRALVFGAEAVVEATSTTASLVATATPPRAR